MIELASNLWSLSVKFRYALVVPLTILVAGLASQLGATEAPSGEALYRQRCQMCHGTPGNPKTLAPDLNGVVGRKAGSTKFSFSTALKQSKITWNRASLDQYLAAPSRMVPGTRMAIGVSNPSQRKAILDYLTANGGR